MGSESIQDKDEPEQKDKDSKDKKIKKDKVKKKVKKGETEVIIKVKGKDGSVVSFDETKE